MVGGCRPCRRGACGVTFGPVSVEDRAARTLARWNDEGELDPADAVDFADCHICAHTHNKGDALAAMGRYRDAWPLIITGALERYRLEGNVPPVPVWQSQMPPCRVHLWRDGFVGVGDMIALTRFIMPLVRRGNVVIISLPPTDKSMISLLARSLPGVVVTAAWDWLVGGEFHLPLSILPAMMNPTVESVTREEPYLRPDPELVQHYRNRIPPDAIGLRWATQPASSGENVRRCLL